MTATDITQIPMSSDLGATLARGADFAGSSGAAEVSLEHLLAALCDDPDAGAVLDASQINAERLKADVVSRVLQGTEPSTERHDSLGVSKDVRRILEAAAAAARGSRRRDINGAIVLAAIVGDARSLAAQILEAHGLTFDNAIRALQAALAPPREAPAQPPAPVADDVLARARERVQSRATPSLREIMKDMPRPAPRHRPVHTLLPRTRPPRTLLTRAPRLYSPNQRCRCRRSSPRLSPNASEPRSQSGKSLRSAAWVTRPGHSRRPKRHLFRRPKLPHRRFPRHSTRNCRLAASAKRTKRNGIGPNRALAAVRQQPNRSVRSQGVPSTIRRGLIPLGRDSKLRPHPRGRTTSHFRRPIRLARHRHRRAPRHLPIFSRICRRAHNLPGYSHLRFHPERQSTADP
ncbi:Clp protease N-terminal domain-containing protein [Hyphomicrobium sp. ghe19]|uniref:Clp protease N-terminal domain-containing protein n=1 Tax=Hyphomicrobium sp. ghe19 TaxID=2682968 RepID=UPI0030CF53C9